MAEGVDELVNHVLSEIALTGVQGMHDSRLLFCFCVLSLSKSDWFACSSRNNASAATRVDLGGRCSRVTSDPALASFGVRISYCALFCLA